MKQKLKKLMGIICVLIATFISLTTITEAKNLREKNRNITEGEIGGGYLYENNFIINHSIEKNGSYKTIYKNKDKFGVMDDEYIYGSKLKYAIFGNEIINMEDYSLKNVDKEERKVRDFLEEHYKSEDVELYLASVTEEGKPIFSYYVLKNISNYNTVYGVAYTDGNQVFNNEDERNYYESMPVIMDGYIGAIQSDWDNKEYILNVKNMDTGKTKVIEFDLGVNEGEFQYVVEIVRNHIYIKEGTETKVFEFKNGELNKKEVIKAGGLFDTDIDAKGYVWQVEGKHVYKYENGKKILKKSYDEEYNRILIYDENRMILSNESENMNGKIKLVYPDVQEGKWVQEDNKWYYIENGIKQIGWKFLNGEYYYLNENGVMQTGWLKKDGNWYYLNASGVMLTEEQSIDGNKYYFNIKGGQMETGWIDDRGRWLYADSNGVLQEGWQLINSKYYYFLENIMLEGWNEIDGDTYYFDYNSGAMQTGWVLFSDYGIEEYLYLDESGQLVKNTWKYINNHWYYLDLDGFMKTGWLNLNGQWFYLNDNGTMQIGWLNLNGTWYYLNQSGAMETGWLDLNGTWYYLNYSGEMQTGWQLISNNWYYMYENGVMATNTVIDGWKIGSNGVAIKL